ncbi:RNA polymerase sigma factor [Clostridium sp. Marseille-P299]|uniref:RNA polymerase sigma factor n=1 Tax=Clostridium sp. Marseille-P299 TaxID=1805477 RepID=UPI00083086A8|nr:sigma-70 family RNA polymerase sigma factor [Clostridium sp. Marseille-P299]
MNDVEELYKMYSHMIFLFLLKMVNYKEDLAEELTQETFYQVCISLHRFKGECEIKTWICQIAKNTCYKYYKKNPIHISMDTSAFHTDYVLESIITPENQIEGNELHQLIIKCMNEMNIKYKDVLVYRLFFEMPFKKIGNIMQISESSAKVIYFRGKELLRKSLEGYL